jgi:hypothetical protein
VLCVKNKNKKIRLRTGTENVKRWVGKRKGGKKINGGVIGLRE